ncbi:outer membrane protein assembly factor BamA [Aliihoeflea sp. PC F10.4]
MKAASSFKSAASAIALSAAIVVTGSVTAQLAATNSAYAAVVNRIEVRGNQRVSNETIIGNLGIQPGQQFSNADINAAVVRLFETRLFSDVRINQSGSTLVVEVSEYSIVNQVIFQGNRRVKDDALTAAVQLRPRGAYSADAMNSDMEAIRQAYARVGRENTTVTAQTVDLGENRLNVVYQIDEGGRTKIGSITFEGNEAFSDGRLRDIIATKQSNFLSWLTRNDIYDDNRLRADEEALRRFYFNRGYADFRILSADGQLNEQTNEYSIVFTIDEGERYTFGNIAVESTVPGVETEAYQRSLDTREGRVYSAQNVETSIVGLTEDVAGSGYAFAQVTPRGNRNFENRTIDVTYVIDEGPRAYIERIEIRGNTRTRDYVIRREFDLSEGDAFNQVLVQRARRRIERLDYFETVNIATAPGSQPDQVVMIVEVVEKPTGEFSIGAGYSTGETNNRGAGFSLEGSVQERNFLGRGQFIRLSAGGGRDSRDIALSFTEPYFLGRRISAGFDIFRNTRRFDNYESEATGGTIRFGLPITEALSTQFAYNYTQEEYDFRNGCEPIGGVLPPDCALNISPILQDAIVNQSPWRKSSVSAGLVFNTIDNMQNPRSGIYSTFTTEVAGLGGDAQWVKFTARGSYYHTLSEELDLVGVLTGGAGHVEGFGDDGLRVFDLFRSNDRIIRGFDFNGMGAYSLADNGRIDHIGGTTYFHASAEAQFPIPGIPESLGFRGAVFADAATLYGVPNSVTENRSGGPDFNVLGDASALRASVGVGLMWASPFGPIRVDYAVPVAKEDSDDVQNFSFGMSTRF